MFYALSKTLDLLLSPLAWALVLVAASSCLAARHSKRVLALGVLSLLVLYIPSTAACASRLSLITESFDGPRASRDARYDAVIVLGGFAQAVPPLARTEYATGVDRMFRALELLRSGRAAKAIIVAGGDKKPVEAELIANALVEFGIARSRLLLGKESLNTRQNALEARDLADRHDLRRLVLVTSAFHVPRAYECFRALGLRPDVIATDFAASDPRSLFEALAPRASNLELSERMLRELAGRWVYRLQGYAKRD